MIRKSQGADWRDWTTRRQQGGTLIEGGRVMLWDYDAVALQQAQAKIGPAALIQQVDVTQAAEDSHGTLRRAR